VLPLMHSAPIPTLHVSLPHGVLCIHSLVFTARAALSMQNGKPTSAQVENTDIFWSK
jgi:hypothetical protein